MCNLVTQDVSPQQMEASMTYNALQSLRREDQRKKVQKNYFLNKQTNNKKCSPKLIWNMENKVRKRFIFTEPEYRKEKGKD